MQAHILLILIGKFPIKSGKIVHFQVEMKKMKQDKIGLKMMKEDKMNDKMRIIITQDQDFEQEINRSNK